MSVISPPAGLDASAAAVPPAAGLRPVSRGPALLRFVLLRVAHAVPTLAFVVLVNFALLSLAPGDLAQVLAGEAGGASADYVQKLRADFGLDEPAWRRLLHYYAKVAQLDLGYSYRNAMPVEALIVERLPATLLLTGTALAIAVLAGVGGAFVATLRPGGWLDRLLSTLALLLYATPGFLLGLGLIIAFGVKLQWLPIGGMRELTPAAGALNTARDVALHVLLPALTLGLFFAAMKFRVARAAMLQVRGQDFIRTARAKGLSPLRIAWRHVLRNAMLPIITMIGMQAATLLGGAVLVEVVFAWPGLGRLAFEAVFQRDFNLLSGVVLVGAMGVVAVNIAVDLLYTVLDPRIELR